ncbi:hypothetical protein HYC85_030164 [Camellia sinensis]|uniref:Uncharacterized protein n=1 Tax=Camellia sinensis TaxID=4442 RepID=A0A7J7FZY4_CAMSI|nr:hypothetical protein HYC85_030164 [Camellia sinensis]
MGVNRLGKVAEPVLELDRLEPSGGAAAAGGAERRKGLASRREGRGWYGSRGRLAWLADAERVGRGKSRLRRLGTRGARVMLKAEAGDAPATKIARDGACDGEMG